MAECNGGYDANFVTEVHDLLKCAVCQFVLKNPVIILECGHRLCKECFENTKDYSILRGFDLLCPLDRTLIDKEKVFPDKGIERRILDLQVKCDNFDKGCTWTKELRQLQEHVSMECPFEIITCHYDGCDENIMRGTLSEHEKTCPMKDYNQTQKIKHLEATVAQIMARIVVCEDKLKLNDQEKEDMSALIKSKDERLTIMATSMKVKDLRLKAIAEKLNEEKEVLDAIRKVVEEVNNKISVYTERIKSLINRDDNNSVEKIEKRLENHDIALDRIKTNFVEIKNKVDNKEVEINVFTERVQDCTGLEDTLKQQEIQVADLCVEIRKINKKGTLANKLKVLDEKNKNVNTLINGLKSEIKTIRILQETILVGYFEWHITNCADKCERKEIVDSLPFSTLNGYECYLKAYLSGKEGEGLGIYICLLAGNRDCDLVWPFNLKVTFECCSVDDVKHKECLQPDEQENLWRARRMEISQGHGFGFSSFLSKPDLDKCIINDSVTIKCYIETIHK